MGRCLRLGAPRHWQSVERVQKIVWQRQPYRPSGLFRVKEQLATLNTGAFKQCDIRYRIARRHLSRRT
ncbi:MAG TPA: hypothetical protein VFA04_24635 [Bryobacteraceae bacterium]|nr:hypothetical protein [Bryobacteraceae bacterium]